MSATPAKSLEDRSSVAHAWNTVGAGGSSLIRCTGDGDVTTLDKRVRLDAVPGQVLAYDERNRPVHVRPRLTLDGDSLELVYDQSRSQRLSTVGDFTFSGEALAQLSRLSPKLQALATSGTRGLKIGADGRDNSIADAQRTGLLVRKYGIHDQKLLRTALMLMPEAVRTVSRLAAADEMTDLFLGAELVAMATDFQRVEHRKPYFREFFAMRNLAAPGAKAYTTQFFDRKGRAEHTANFRGRAPTVTMVREEKMRPLVWIRAGMTWTWLELQEWAQARSNGAPLPDFVGEQRDGAREAALEVENLDLVFGNPTLQIQGILSADNGIPTPAAANNYADQATTEDAVQLLLVGAKAIVATESDAVPEIIMLGTRDYIYVTTTRYDASNSAKETIADVALASGKGLGVKAIVRMPELGYSADVEAYLATLGYSGAELQLYSGGMFNVAEDDQLAVQLTISRNPKKIRGVTGQDFMQLPPDKTSTETHVQVCLSTGGVEVLHPMSAHRQPIKDPT